MMKNTFELCSELPPLMSNLEIEKKTEEAPRRQQEGEHDPIKHANSLLAFFHDAIEGLNSHMGFDRDTLNRFITQSFADPRFADLMKVFSDDAASSDVGTTIPDKVASRDDIEALIPEDPDDWTEEMWDYCYEMEQEDMRNFAEQQLALQQQLDGKL
ncbi:PREDICTED: uncharacterized protein LOC103324722 [Prunus mume]|uniref:Uncharacterized protein LOC103324722 n=1 Tax=Prunus mume TaxID=102107 RepID=A0ABM0NHW1_PRUMU|nr:PREDICTED: uncharacterized protein LOC103324722 [Prunus mume]